MKSKIFILLFIPFIKSSLSFSSSLGTTLIKGDLSLILFSFILLPLTSLLNLLLNITTISYSVISDIRITPIDIIAKYKI